MKVIVPNKKWKLCRFGGAFLCVAGLLLLAPASSFAIEKWLYLPQNLSSQTEVRQVAFLLERASRAGYTRAFITDTKLDSLHRQPASYFSHIELIKQVALDQKIELTPGILLVGYSAEMLSRNPNLAEGPPVKNQRFVVVQGRAVLRPEKKAILRGGDFSQLDLWDWRDEACVDAEEGTVRFSKMDQSDAKARIVQKIQVQPWKQYRLRVNAKSKNFTQNLQLLLQDDSGHEWCHQPLGIETTQGWKVHEICFNSYDNSELNLYFGAWGQTEGKLWLDDCEIEEVAFVNLLRRPGTPLRICRESDGYELKEGEDFEELVDTKLGRIEYAGNFNGWHEPPQLILPNASKFPDGTVLLADYWHAQVVGKNQVTIDLSAPETKAIFQEIVQQNHELWNAKSYLIRHDEIRAGGRSDSATKQGMTPGQSLASNIRFCSELIREKAPESEIFVWNSMFDPHHNAVHRYYFTNGTLEGSWEGLDPSVTVMNWAHFARDKSLPFFAKKGHRQVIAGFYDAPLHQINQWKEAAADIGGIRAFLYATWENDYSKLEEVSVMLEDWEKKPR